MIGKHSIPLNTLRSLPFRNRSYTLRFGLPVHWANQFTNKLYLNEILFSSLLALIQVRIDRSSVPLIFVHGDKIGDIASDETVKTKALYLTCLSQRVLHDRDPPAQRPEKPSQGRNHSILHRQW